MSTRALAVVVLFAACSSDADQTPDAQPLEQGIDADSDLQSETARPDQGGRDVPSDVKVPAQDQLADQQPQPDLSTLDTKGRPVGQCFGDEHCFFSAPCDVAAPGGVCTKCTMPSDCGDTFIYDCGADGACKRLCSNDKHCPLAHYCSDAKLCEVLQCGDKTDCPSPYTCQDGRCARPSCTSGCPPTMFCGDADICLENYP